MLTVRQVLNRAKALDGWFVSPRGFIRRRTGRSNGQTEDVVTAVANAQRQVFTFGIYDASTAFDVIGVSFSDGYALVRACDSIHASLRQKVLNALGLEVMA